MYESTFRVALPLEMRVEKVVTVGVVRKATKILLKEGLENGKNCDVILMTHFSDVIFLTSYLAFCSFNHATLNH